MEFCHNNPKELATALKTIKNACATSEHREALKGVELAVDGDKLTITALDGLILAQRVLTVAKAKNGSCCIDPNRLINAIDGTADDVKVLLDDDYITVASGETTTRFKRICADYIDHKKITGIESYQCFKIHVNPMYMVKVLRAFCKSNRECVELILDSSDKHKPLHVCNKNGDRGMVLPVRVNE